jgi:hypothetical protein
VGANLPTFNHLTNTELLRQLTLRDDLTDIEYLLIERLQEAEDALEDMESPA